MATAFCNALVAISMTHPFPGNRICNAVLFVGKVVVCVIHLPYLRLLAAWYRWRIARINRQLRRHGIDPEAIPEIQELRRRYRQLREERERSARAQRPDKR
jgi:hypothetical protein